MPSSQVLGHFGFGNGQSFKSETLVILSGQSKYSVFVQLIIKKSAEMANKKNIFFIDKNLIAQYIKFLTYYGELFNSTNF